VELALDIAGRADALDQGTVAYPTAASELPADNEIKERYCSIPDAAPVALLRCADEQVRLPGGDDDLDGVLNPVAGVAEGGRQIGERERMGVNPRRVEALFGH
jgi:hypothetical protein